MGKENPPLIFRYKNWEGKEAVRKVRPLDVWYGETEWHPEKQWFLKAWDLDKDAERNFALKDIIQFLTEEAN